MTYSSVTELPTEVRRAFSEEDASTWMYWYNTAYEELVNDSSEDSKWSVTYFAKERAWEQCKNLTSSRYVMSNVSTEVVDKDGDIADVDAYVDAGREFVMDGGQVARNHSNKTIGVVWKVFKATDNNSGKPCVVACVNFFRDRPVCDRAWEDFKGRKLEWSIGSIVTAQRECNKTKCYNKLRPKQWFELSLVDFARNPITYNIEVNEASKGEADTNIEIHDEEVCPILQKYYALGAKIPGYVLNIVDGAVILISGENFTDEAYGIVSQEYPESDYILYRGEIDDGKDYCMIIPRPIEVQDEFIENMLTLIEDEKEAIDNYRIVTQSLVQGQYLTEEEVKSITDRFEEIIRDEEDHQEKIKEIIKEILPDEYSSIVNEEDVTEKGCPAGQHEHAGVVGCHSVFRKHSVDYQTNPSQVLDLTNENIDVEAIKSTPTPKLKEIVVKIAKALTRADEQAVKQFMSHTSGKEFVLAYLELKHRQMHGDDGMENTKAEETTEAVPKEAEKGLLADPQTSIATIASTLASIVPLLDGMNARLLRVETTLANKSEDNADITSAILSDTSITGEVEEAKAPEQAPVPPVAEEKKEEPPVEPDPKEEDEAKAEPPADEEKEEDKEEKPAEESEDSKEEEPKSEEEDKPKEDKEESKEDEDKEEEKKDEVKKGTEEEVPATETVAEPPAEEVVKAAEPDPVEEVKAEPVTIEPTEVTPTVTEPVVEQSAPIAEPVVEEITYPQPRGRANVDFHALHKTAVEKRAEELKAKGVNFTVAQPSSSLAQSQQYVQPATGGVSLVQPTTNVSPFNGGVEPVNHSMKGLWKEMGKCDPKTFFNKLKGE